MSFLCLCLSNASMSQCRSFAFAFAFPIFQFYISLCFLCNVSAVCDFAGAVSLAVATSSHASTATQPRAKKIQNVYASDTKTIEHFHWCIGRDQPNLSSHIGTRCMIRMVWCPAILDIHQTVMKCRYSLVSGPKLSILNYYIVGAVSFISVCTLYAAFPSFLIAAAG